MSDDTVIIVVYYVCCVCSMYISTHTLRTLLPALSMRGCRSRFLIPFFAYPARMVPPCLWAMWHRREGSSPICFKFRGAVSTKYAIPFIIHRAVLLTTVRVNPQSSIALRRSSRPFAAVCTVPRAAEVTVLLNTPLTEVLSHKQLHTIQYRMVFIISFIFHICRMIPS
jgi:hypothetical protein